MFERHKSIFKNGINSKFKKQFSFFTSTLADYVGHDSPKESLNNHFGNKRAGFLLSCQN